MRRRQTAVVVAGCLLAAGCSGGAPAGPGPSPSAGLTTRAPAPAATGAGTSPQPSCSTGAVLAGWPVQRLAAQTLVVTVEENATRSVAPEVAAGAGGVLLRGTHGPADLGAVLASLRTKAPGGIEPFVMTDEEGGAVQRMANLVGVVPSARAMAAMTPAEITQTATALGRRLRALGVTVDLAPVLDLDAGPGPNASDPDGTRSFSLSAAVATKDGLAFAAGLQAAGVMPVVKHFPGLGGATANTDDAAAMTRPWSELQGAGLLPFSAAVRAGLPAVMVTNASVPGLSTVPASISPAVISGVLRHQLGFHGLVITDSLSGGALVASGSSVQSASVAALVAGADLVLFDFTARKLAAGYSGTVAAIVVAVTSGRLSRARLEDAVGHVLTAKAIDLCR
ncbi:MAG TPA: glycoside hydrolase family 3 N-terminal domain-containing protein [Actinomycetes bacterium]